MRDGGQVRAINSRSMLKIHCQKPARYDPQ